MNTQQTILSISLQRPAGSARRQQRVVLVRDGSASMQGEKADAASQATAELCRVLALPSNRDGFHMAVVDFGEKAKVVHGFERATMLDGYLRPLDVGEHGGVTNITSGLEQALDLLQEAGENQSAAEFARSVVVLLSDGAHNHGPAPDQASYHLKNIADLVCVAFGDDADLPALRRLATSPQHCVRCSSGEELRRFFAQVGVTLTRTLASCSNATVALAKLQSSQATEEHDALQPDR
jgi:uncharacterized protein YegL